MLECFFVRIIATRGRSLDSPSAYAPMSHTRPQEIGARRLKYFFTSRRHAGPVD